MKNVTDRILGFYQQNKRDLPWRNIENPYYTLVSEIMLQQTRVDTVIPYFLRFVDKLPKIEDLANISEDELMKLWQGLGYYRRAKNLQNAAKMVMSDFNGEIPSTYQELMLLPGIGDYTAKAILSIAFHQKAVAVDGNVLRVFTRYYGIYDDITSDKTKPIIEEKVSELFPNHHQSDFMQALMEIGAIICLPNGEPKCGLCPLKEECFAYNNNQINQLPVKSKKDKQRIEQKTVFIIRYQESIWIQKREEKGLLSSLWELPNTDGHLDTNQATQFLYHLGLNDFTINPGKDKKHIFTHIIWEMKSYNIDLLTSNDHMIPESQIELDYSIPTAFHSFLK